MSITKEEDTKSLKYTDLGNYYLYGPINEEIIKPAIEWIFNENVTKKHNELNLIITSPGGYVTSCFALLDAIEGSAIPINTVGLGLIASCGLIIFLHGKKRTMTPLTYCLSHQFSGGSGGKYHELLADRAAHDWMHEKILQIYIKKTGLSAKKVRELLLPPSDVFLTAEECIKYNIATEIKNKS